ncbi:MAG: hypothetical protein ACYC5N_04965, partial [Endomicrobiales bacterium]
MTCFGVIGKEVRRRARGCVKAGLLRRAVAVTVSACFLLNIAGVSAFAGYSDYERMRQIQQGKQESWQGQKQKSVKDAVVVPGTEEQKPEPQQSGDQPETTPAGVPATEGLAGQQNPAQQGYTQQESLLGKEPNAATDDKKENNSGDQVKVGQEEAGVQGSEVQKVTVDVQVDPQVVVKRMRNDALVTPPINMAEVQEIAAGEEYGIDLVANDVTGQDLSELAQEGLVIAHFESLDATYPDLFVTIGQDGNVRYEMEGQKVVMSLKQFQDTVAGEYQWDGKVLQVRQGGEQDGIGTDEKVRVMGVFSEETLAGFEGVQAQTESQSAVAQIGEWLTKFLNAKPEEQRAMLQETLGLTGEMLDYVMSRVGDIAKKAGEVMEYLTNFVANG